MSAGISVEELVGLMVISFYEKNSLFLKNGDLKWICILMQDVIHLQQYLTTKKEDNSSFFVRFRKP